MALIKVRHLIVLLLIFLLAACGGATVNNTTGDDGGLDPDITPRVTCDDPLNPPKLLDPDDPTGFGPSLLQESNIGGTINFVANTVLESGCYQIINQLSIPDNVQLTILPNTTLLFDQDHAGISVAGGSIVADGTAQEPILFSSSSKSHWAGIRLVRRNLVESKFNYTIIEYAGSGKFFNSKAAFGVIHDRNNTGEKGRLTFTNNIIRSTAASSEYVFIAGDFAYFNEFKNNKIYDNPIPPISVTFNEAHFIDRSNSFSFAGTGNDDNKIVIVKPLVEIDPVLDTSNSLEAFRASSITWAAHEIPYLIKNNIRVAHTTLNIEAGAELQFDQNTGLTIINDAVLSAVGNNQARIVFTKNDDPFQPTDRWNGVQFTNSDSLNNRLEYVDIYFGGRGEGTITNPGQNLNANLILNSSARVKIANTKIQFSTFGYGFYVDSSSRFHEFSNNTVSNNFLGAGLIAVPGIDSLGTNSDFSNNGSGGNSYIEVLNPTTSLGGAAQIRSVNTPYAFFDNFIIDSDLTIDAGATLLFDENTTMEIRGTGRLTAVGSQSQVITFSTLAQLTGGIYYWDGILFNGTQGQLSNVEIFYGGFPNVNNPQLPSAAVRLITSNSNSRVQIEDSEIGDTNAGAYAIYIAQGSDIIGNINSIREDNGICRAGTPSC